MRFTAPEVSAAKAKTTVVKDEFEPITRLSLSQSWQTHRLPQARLI